MNFCFYVNDGSPHHTRKIHYEGSLICTYSYYPLPRRKRSQIWKELAFTVRGVSSFLDDQSPVACLQHFFHERHGSHLEISSQQCEQYAHSPPGPFFVQDHGSDLNIETPQILPGEDLNLPQMDVKLTITPGFSTNDANCKDQI